MQDGTASKFCGENSPAKSLCVYLPIATFPSTFISVFQAVRVFSFTS